MLRRDDKAVVDSTGLFDRVHLSLLTRYNVQVCEWSLGLEVSMFPVEPVCFCRDRDVQKRAGARLWWSGLLIRSPISDQLFAQCGITRIRAALAE